MKIVNVDGERQTGVTTKCLEILNDEYNCGKSKLFICEKNMSEFYRNKKLTSLKNIIISDDFDGLIKHTGIHCFSVIVFDRGSKELIKRLKQTYQVDDIFITYEQNLIRKIKDCIDVKESEIYLEEYLKLKGYKK